MHRSASASRVWDDRFSYHSSPASSKASSAQRAALLKAGELPVYDPFSEAAKKEKGGAKFAENAIHVIPFVLLFCAFVLWFFSNPDVEVTGNSLAEKMEGKTIEGDLDSDGTGHLPVDLGDLDPTKLADSKTLISDNKP
ncbi:hypothetical protein Pfo_027685 [Paulownia fortunei]|nr:hypothetical protein Pfo_027685 [Paulownia fortunei]